MPKAAFVLNHRFASQTREVGQWWSPRGSASTIASQDCPSGENPLASIDLSAAPFNLDDEAMAWVHATRDGLAPRDKLAQLFVLLARGPADEALEAIKAFRPGGITRIYS